MDDLERDLFSKYKITGLKLRIVEILAHPSGNLVVAELRSIGPNGLPYDSIAMHLYAKDIPPTEANRWTYGLPFPRHLAGPLAGGLNGLAEREFRD